MLSSQDLTLIGIVQKPPVPVAPPPNIIAPTPGLQHPTTDPIEEPVKPVDAQGTTNL